MTIRIQYQKNMDFPKLGWIATIDMGKEKIKITHGISVECRDKWMVEGVWDGPFGDGNFHKSEHFFGSGCRLDGDKVYFVTTSTPIDRLMFCRYRNDYIFSNSLVLLLAYTGASLDPTHDYHKESMSICKGLAAYEKEYAIIHPEIPCFYQVFVENTVINKEGLSFQRRDRNKQIKSFDHYHRRINNILHNIKQNYESKKRKIAVSAFSTMSTGYDSVAVSALVKQIGVKKVFTGNPIKAPLQLVSMASERKYASNIARSLGLEVIYLDNRRSSISEDELFFLATNYPKNYTNSWSDIGLHSMAKHIEKNCTVGVVFCGHHGDIVWDVNIQEKHLNRNMTRSMTMGFWGEARFKSAFIVVPVPGLLCTQVQDIVKISKSPEMQCWRLNNGYDRPIPRRIAETAGVKRHQFGMQKKYIAPGKYMWPINSILRQHFFAYVKQNYGINRISIYMEYIIQKLYQKLLHKYIFSKLGVRKRYENLILNRNTDLYFLMSQWAVSLLSSQSSQLFYDEKLANYSEKTYWAGGSKEESSPSFGTKLNKLI